MGLVQVIEIRTLRFAGSVERRKAFRFFNRCEARLKLPQRILQGRVMGRTKRPVHVKVRRFRQQGNTCEHAETKDVNFAPFYQAHAPAAAQYRAESCHAKTLAKTQTISFLFGKLRECLDMIKLCNAAEKLN